MIPSDKIWIGKGYWFDSQRVLNLKIVQQDVSKGLFLCRSQSDRWAINIYSNQCKWLCPDCRPLILHIV